MPLAPEIVAEFSCWKRLIDCGTTSFFSVAIVDAGITEPFGART